MSACEVRVLRAAALGHMPIGSDRSSRASCGVGAALCAGLPRRSAIGSEERTEVRDVYL